MAGRSGGVELASMARVRVAATVVSSGDVAVASIGGAPMHERVDSVRVGVSRSSRRDGSVCGDVASSPGGELCALVASVELRSIDVSSWRVEGGGAVDSVVDVGCVESVG